MCWGYRRARVCLVRSQNKLPFGVGIVYGFRDEKANESGMLLAVGVSRLTGIFEFLCQPHFFIARLGVQIRWNVSNFGIRIEINQYTGSRRYVRPFSHLSRSYMPFVLRQYINHKVLRMIPRSRNILHPGHETKRTQVVHITTWKILIVRTRDLFEWN